MVSNVLKGSITMRQGTFQWMKSVNKSTILNKIRTEGPISRAQIAKDTKLTPPTVSSNVRELIEQDIVKESDLGESQGGRKPTMLLINHQAFYVIGVDAGSERIDFILADLEGKVVNQISRKVALPASNEGFVETLKDGIKTIIDGAPIEQEKIVGIGIAMHGVVDVDTGISQFAPNIGLTNIPIKAELEKAFALEVKVENDARAMALGEAWFGNHGDVGSMLVVNIGRGVGAGVIIDGKLYHGAQDLAGEVGHMTIDINGQMCTCGNKGCLQTFITGPAIAKRAEHIVDQGMTGEAVFEQARSGNKQLVHLFEEVGEMIGIGLTNLIHIINPEKVVLGGGVTKAESLLLPRISQTIKERALTPQAKQTDVVIGDLGDRSTIIGAATLILEDIFDPI